MGLTSQTRSVPVITEAPELKLKLLALSLLVLQLCCTAVHASPQQRSSAPSSLSEVKIEKKNYFVGQISLDASPQRVWEILRDYENADSNFTYVKRCKKLKDIDGKEHVAMTVQAGPIDFHYVIEVTRTGTERIEWKRVSGAFKANEGYWKLEQADNGRRTLVTYAKHVDGGLLLPNFIVGKAIKESIPQILADLKQSVEKQNVRMVACHQDD